MPTQTSAGLIAYWNFDTDNDKDMSARDWSGLSNDLISSYYDEESIRFSTDVPSVFFTNSKSSIISAGDGTWSTPKNVLYGQNVFTITMWIKNQGNYGELFTIGNSGFLGARAIDLSLGTITYYNAMYPLSSVGTIADNMWQHIAVTYDGTTCKLYLNGTLDNSVTSALDTTSNAYTTYIGSGQYAEFVGLLDDIRVYNRSLSSTEIANIAGGSEAPLEYVVLSKRGQISGSGTTGDSIHGSGTLTKTKSILGSGKVLCKGTGTLTTAKSVSGSGTASQSPRTGSGTLTTSKTVSGLAITIAKGVGVSLIKAATLAGTGVVSANRSGSGVLISSQGTFAGTSSTPRTGGGTLIKSKLIMGTGVHVGSGIGFLSSSKFLSGTGIHGDFISTTIAGSIPLYVRGFGRSQNSLNLVVQSYVPEPISATLPLVVRGKQPPLVGNNSLLKKGFGPYQKIITKGLGEDYLVPSEEPDYFITKTLNLFVEGYSPLQYANSRLNLFVAGANPSISAVLPLFLYNNTQLISEYLDLFVEGEGESPGFIPAHSRLNLFVEGSAGGPLSTAVPISNTLPLYVRGELPANVTALFTQLNIYVKGKESMINTTLPLFIEGQAISPDRTEFVRPLSITSPRT